MNKYAICISATLLLMGTAAADIIHVPADSLTIQAGLNGAFEGDTVLVASGSYYENIIWPNTGGVSLMSAWGPDATIIDGSDAGSVIAITCGVDTTTLIYGFTIQHGNATYGGGVRIENSSAVIKGNRIVYNSALPRGGGVYCGDGASPVIIDNIINNNSVPGTSGYGVGGGICCTYAGSPMILGNTISQNFASSRGGAIDLYGTSPERIAGNTIENNSAGTDGGAIACGSGSSPYIYGNRIGNNSAGYTGGAISCSWNSNPVIEFNSILDNSAGWQYSGGIDCGTGSAFPTINHNDICGNTPYGLFNHSAVQVVNAEYNWWNDSNGPGGSGPGNGDWVSGHVDYDPWLSVPADVEEDDSSQGFGSILSLAQNSPNPFSAITIIAYRLPQASHASLRIYDTSGRLVRTIVSGRQNAGPHTVNWNARDESGARVAPGIYFYGLRAGSYSATKKMLVLKM